MRQPRRGVTLTEVLVAIFVCSLGLMALMTLFPLGAMNMAQALKDDRCAVAGANGAAILRSTMRLSLAVNGPPGDASLTTFQGLLTAGPVYLDPIGVNAFGNAPVGGVIPRYSFTTAGGTSAYTNALSWCTLLDDIDFAPDGTAVPAQGSVEISRQTRYSWAWMVRWLPSNQPQPPPAAPMANDYRTQMPAYARALEFAVVVYHNRAVSATAGFVPAAEYAFPATFDAAANQITFSYGAQKPPIKKGGWVMDGSPGEGRFYRVTGVNQSGAGTLILSLQTPLRRTSGGGTLVVLDNVAEVFDRLTLQ